VFVLLLLLCCSTWLLGSFFFWCGPTISSHPTLPLATLIYIGNRQILMELPIGDIKVSGNDAILHEHVENMKEYVSGKIYVLCGLQGSGKGSAAKYISSLLGMLHISTGDLFRDEVKKGTEIGMVIGKYMETGQFVPPEFANSILSNRLKQPDTQCGVLLDGFPRSIEHLLDLDAILAPLNRKVECAFYIDVPESECFRRLTGRRCCPTCQSIFHVSFHKDDICNNCHGVLEIRKDDSEEVIKRRLDLSKSTLGPLLDELKCRDLLFSLNCCDSPSIAATSNKIIEVMCYPCRFLTPGCQSAYARLALHMQHVMKIGSTGNAATDDVCSPNVAEIVRRFRDNSLVENGHKRTGVLRKFVYLSSANTDKLAEFVRVFDRYGIEVLQMPPVPENTSLWSSAVHDLIRCLLSEKSPGLVPVAVLRETSALLKPSVSCSEPVCEDIIPAMMSAANRSTLRTGVNANHVSVLHAWFLRRENDGLGVKLATYVNSTKGRIVAAPSGLQSVLFPVFGWDDRFVLLSTGMDLRCVC
jgi:adenylate kinase